MATVAVKKRTFGPGSNGILMTPREFDRADHWLRKHVSRAAQVYRTEIPPGLELPLAKLFALAHLWPSEEQED